MLDEYEAAIEALVTYGDHIEDCPVRGDYEATCTCGWVNYGHIINEQARRFTEKLDAEDAAAGIVDDSTGDLPFA